MRAYHIFIRTKRALIYSREDILQLNALMSYRVEFFRYGRRAGHWEDGLVVRLLAHDGLDDIVSDLAPTLDTHFEAWSCFDGTSSHEHPMTAGLDLFLREHTGAAASKIYLRYNPNIRSEIADVDRLRAHLANHGVCRPVFYFRNGMILCVGSQEPPKIVFHRALPLARKLPMFVFENPEGFCFSCSGNEKDEDIWQDPYAMPDPHENKAG